MIMRLFISVLFASLLATLAAAVEPARPATAEETALLNDALKNTAQDPERWAYTESTVVQFGKGKDRKETVVRFDPSKPYEEQYTPLLIEGRAPTAKDLKKYRKKGEERGRQRIEELKRRELAAGDEKEAHLTINRSRAQLDLEHPLVAREEAERIVFEIPLRSEDRAIPADKLQIQVRVNRQARQLERATLRVLDAFRLKLVAKVKRGEASAEFSVVDPAYGPVITGMAGDFGASMVMIPVKASFSGTRTEWQRVTPFDERFSVKLAPLQMLGF